jgi:hypothetical protein
MSAKIVGTFLRAALGPVQYAAGLIMSNKIRKGLHELSPEPLEAALRRGISDVARLVALAPADIEAELPMAAFGQALARMRIAHPEAMRAWEMHAGPTGFMDVMTALTIDGRKPEIGMCIERVAKKLGQDKGLTGPLLELAHAINAWEELISLSVTALERDGWAAKALLKRRVRWGIVVAIPVVAAIACLVLGLRVMRSRNRVDEGLAGADPCIASAIDPADRRFATKAQEEKITSAIRACDEAKVRAEEEARIAAEKRAEEERKHAIEKAHFDACQRVAASVAEGSYPNIDAGDVVPADAGPLLARIASHKLVATDLGPDAIAFPCGDTAFEKDIESAYTQAVLAAPDLWKDLAEPSSRTEQILTANKDVLPAEVTRSIAEAAEESSKKSLTTGDRDALARSKKVCHVARLVFAGELRYCAVVDKL